MAPGSLIDLTISPALLAEIQEAAAQEHRPANDVVRDALERYLAEWRRESALARTPGAAPEKRSAREAAARLREQRQGNIPSIRGLDDSSIQVNETGTAETITCA